MSKQEIKDDLLKDFLGILDHCEKCNMCNAKMTLILQHIADEKKKADMDDMGMKDVDVRKLPSVDIEDYNNLCSDCDRHDKCHVNGEINWLKVAICLDEVSRR